MPILINNTNSILPPNHLQEASPLNTLTLEVTFNMGPWGSIRDNRSIHTFTLANTTVEEDVVP